MNHSLKVWQREDIISILGKHMLKERFGIKSLLLFGSVARNQATDASDLDFVVDFEESITFDRYMDLKIFLEDLFDREVDLAIKDSLKPQIQQKVVKEAINIQLLT